MSSNASISLNEAYMLYVDQLKGAERHENYQDLTRFVRWCGKSNGIGGLTPQTVAAYAEWISLVGVDSARKLIPVKSFLSFLKRKGYVEISLAPHVRIPKTNKRSQQDGFRVGIDHANLTAEGYTKLTKRLKTLKEQRGKVTEDIGRAMADKDFRENAPLDAAKERQGLIESMIRDLETTLNTAIITDPSTTKETSSMTLGKSVVLKDSGTDKKFTYMLVHPTEANPAEGKISSASPVGKALIGKVQGEEVEISAPKGTIRYIIEKIKTHS